MSLASVRSRKGALFYIVVAGILGVLLFAALVGKALEIIVSSQAGEAEDTVITVKTGVDYSDSYTRLAGVSSLHPAIHENGLRGGYAPGTNPPQTESIGGQTLTYWRRGGTNYIPTSDTLVDELYQNTFARFNAYITNLQNVRSGGWRINAGPLTRVYTTATTANGTFAVSLTRPNINPSQSIGTESTLIVNEKEDVTTVYRRLHEVGSVLVNNAEGLIEARVLQRLRELRDHYSTSTTCTAGCSGCWDNRCPNSPLNDNPVTAANNALEALEGELNGVRAISQDGIRFDLSLAKSTPTAVTVEKARREEQGGRSFLTGCVNVYSCSDWSSWSCNWAPTGGPYYYECRQWSSRGDCIRLESRSGPWDPATYRCGTNCDWFCFKTRTCSTTPVCTCEARWGSCTCTRCAEAHYDRYYKLESWAVRVEVIDTRNSVYTANGLQHPRMVFLIEGRNLQDNTCDRDHSSGTTAAHDCGGGFTTTPPITQTWVGSLDWSDHVQPLGKRGIIPPELRPNGLCREAGGVCRSLRVPFVPCGDGGGTQITDAAGCPASQPFCCTQ